MQPTIKSVTPFARARVRLFCLQLIPGVIRHRDIAAVVVAGTTVVAAGYLAGWHRDNHGLWDDTVSTGSMRIQTPSVVAEATQVGGSGTPAEQHAATELRAMSQSFRNSTLLIAIHGAGFYCDDIVSAKESIDGVWLASCADKLGYTVSVLDTDQFDVRPIAHYFDGIGPVPIVREPDLEPYEQERLRQ